MIAGSAGATIPVSIVTGFLGSGKTTLLNRVLTQPNMAGTLAIINEFGEIGLDHLLVEVSKERLALLDNGCVCCTVRDDLVSTLKQVAANRPVERVILETTGLADPAPILHAMMADPVLAARFRIAGVITTLDAVNGAATLETYAEARKQLAVADQVVLTKTDIADRGARHAAEHWIGDLAPSARLYLADALDPASLLEQHPSAWRDASDVVDALDRLSGHDHCHADGCDHHHHAGQTDIRTFAFVVDQPIEWAAFRQWLDYFAAIRGADLLRMKGLVGTTDAPDQPILLHGVQHVLHAPKRLEAWPSCDRRTRLIFIVRNLSRETIETTLAKFAGIEIRRLARAAA